MSVLCYERRRGEEWELGDVLINNVQHTVGNEHVGYNDLGGIHEDSAVLISRDAELAVVVFGLERGAILERGRVVHVFDDVVLEDGLEVVAREISQRRADVVEGFVVGREDGDVAGGGCFDGVGCVDGAAERSEVQGVGHVEDVGG